MNGSQLPKNLCVVPFVHLSSKPNGTVRPCCFSTELIQNKPAQYLNLGKDSFQSIWNGSGMRGMRQKMLKGEKVKGCEHCWKEEAHGKISKRMRENKRYRFKVNKALKEAYKNQGALTTGVFYLDLRLGNTCNLKCRTCNPAFSSLWYKELKKHQNTSFKNDRFYNLDRFDSKMNDWYKNNQIFALLEEIGPSLELLYISGGEPLLIKEHHLFLDYLIKKQYSSKIQINLNTNLTHLNEKLLKQFYKFKKVCIGVSIDAFGEKNNWMRSPSKFTTIEQNLKTLLVDAKNIETSINCTISVFNILYLEELIKWSMNLTKTLNVKPLRVQLDLLHQPEYQQLQLLPLELKPVAIDRLNKIKKLYPVVVQKNEVDSLIAMLSQPETEHTHQLRRLLKEEIKEIDKWRNENFYKIFSEFKDSL